MSYMKKVTAEDISLEMFRISKNLMLLADVALAVAPALVETLLDLSDEARSVGDDFLDIES